MVKLSLLAAALILSFPLIAVPLSPTMQSAIMVLADQIGVPRSVAKQQQIEESGGDPLAVSHESVRGFHSVGLYQLYTEPSNIVYLMSNYWTVADGHFDILDPIDNATVAFRYLADLHARLGTWYAALCWYNAGRVKGVSKETRAYAKRIVEAH